MTDAEKLKVYDELRKAHSIIHNIYEAGLLTNGQQSDYNAVNSVSGVLYLSEGYFARMEQ